LGRGLFALLFRGLKLGIYLFLLCSDVVPDIFLNMIGTTSALHAFENFLHLPLILLSLLYGFEELSLVLFHVIIIEAWGVPCNNRLIHRQIFLKWNGLIMN